MKIALTARFAHLDRLLGKEMAFEHDFVKAGGTLLAGSDPTGPGSVLAGFADQREVELLVQAGFTPVEAIHIATQNGAEFLGIGGRVGTISPGKQADLVVVEGNPSRNISDIRNVEIVFRNGIGYSPVKLLARIDGVGTNGNWTSISGPHGVHFEQGLGDVWQANVVTPSAARPRCPVTSAR